MNSQSGRYEELDQSVSRLDDARRDSFDLLPAIAVAQWAIEELNTITSCLRETKYFSINTSRMSGDDRAAFEGGQRQLAQALGSILVSLAVAAARGNASLSQCLGAVQGPLPDQDGLEDELCVHRWAEIAVLSEGFSDQEGSSLCRRIGAMVYCVEEGIHRYLGSEFCGADCIRIAFASLPSASTVLFRG